jgi:hypothetical protein
MGPILNRGVNKAIAGARQPLRTALAVAVVGQALFTGCGSQLPNPSDSYGAPFTIGESAGWNVLFTAGMGSFWLPQWFLNVLVTALLLLLGAIVLHGRTVPGVIGASLAVAAAYATVLVLPGSKYNSNQLAIWIWMLVVVTAVWGINRLMAAKAERGS